MKTLRVSWDRPAAEPDFYLVRWLTSSREVHGTECDIDVPEDFAGTVQVVAVANGIESEPCAVWYEDVTLSIRWDDTHSCVIVSIPTLVTRRYSIERSTDQGRTWQEFASFSGTGRNEDIGGGTEKDARFRAWSKPIGSH